MKQINYHFFEILNHTYLLAATDKGLCFVGSQDKGLDELKHFYPEATLREGTDLNIHYEQLDQYLSGKRSKFTVQTDILGTDFQQAVWKQLLKIPYGETTNYTMIAKSINRPKAVRAVGSAIGKNPLLMVIPCHRVLTKDNQLGGYRGGFDMKRSLLALEQHNKI